MEELHVANRPSLIDQWYKVDKKEEKREGRGTLIDQWYKVDKKEEKRR
jgi:hypothetical protein